MVEGARCWADEVENSRFRSAEVQITYMIVRSSKFLVILYI